MPKPYASIIAKDKMSWLPVDASATAAPIVGPMHGVHVTPRAAPEAAYAIGEPRRRVAILLALETEPASILNGESSAGSKIMIPKKTRNIAPKLDTLVSLICQLRPAYAKRKPTSVVVAESPTARKIGPFLSSSSADAAIIGNNGKTHGFNNVNNPAKYPKKTSSNSLPQILILSFR